MRIVQWTLSNIIKIHNIIQEEKCFKTDKLQWNVCS